MNVEPWLLCALDGVHRGTALDVGANAGWWTSLLAAEFERVVAIEPDSRIFASLSASLPSNAEARHAAICGRNAQVVLKRRESTEYSSLLDLHPIGGRCASHVPAISEEIVEGYTLDAAFPGGAEFVKMDIEGGEVEALTEASGEIWRRATFLVECHDTLQDVLAILVRLGKRVELIPHPYPEDAHPGHCWAVGRP